MVKSNNDMVLDFLPWCKRVAKDFEFKFGSRVFDSGDFENIAVLALYQALENYDPTKGSFISYGSYYVYGALFRSIRNAGNQVVFDDFDALFLNNDLPDYQAKESIKGQLFALEKSIAIDRILVGVASLSSKHRFVVVLHYFYNFSLKDLSSLLKLSSSRVSQIHLEAISQLKEEINECTKFSGNLGISI